MKFGRNLPRNQVPQWASEYIDYKGLKKLIKAAATEVKDGQEPDLAGAYRFKSLLDLQSLMFLQSSSIHWTVILKLLTASITENMPK